jgi:rod shape-determining protein MreB and related proteins
LRYLLGLVERRDNQKLYAVVGAPARSTMEDKQAIIRAADGLVDALLVVSEPFLVAYNLGLFADTIIVDIGGGTLDICRMPGTIPEEVDQRTLHMAGNDIDKKLHDLLKEKYPGISINLPVVKKIKEAYAFVGDMTEKIDLEFSVDGKLTTIDIVDEMREACSMLVPEICENLTELIVSFDPEFMAGLARNIILAGGGSRIKGLASEIEAVLSDDLGGVLVTVADDPLFCGALGGLKLAQEMPAEEWEE